MINEEYLEDLMTYHIINEKVENNSAMKLPLHQLTDDDKELLIEYAPKLFNTYSGNNIKEIMLDLAILIHNYRNNNLGNIIIDMVFKNYPIILKNKSDSDRKEALKKHIEVVIKLLGGNIAGTKKGNDLKNILQDVLNNVDDYYLTKTKKFKYTKDGIRNYLTSLQLENKSHEISNFIKKLE